MNAPASGVTLVEMLVVIGIAGILFAVGFVSLVPTYNGLQTRDAAQQVTGAFQLAQSLTRKKNVNATVTLDRAARTVRVVQAGTTVATYDLPVTTIDLACRTSCPTPVGTASSFTFTAPFGSLAWDVKVELKRGSKTRYAYVLGQTAITAVRE